MRHRSPAYWPTRILLGVGIVSTAAVTLLAGAVLNFGPLAEPCFHCETPIVPAAVAVGLAVVGLLWMIRVFRGLRNDEPPPWRHRDR